ncbi:MAG TPA: 2-phosphosulfolactate phosphatase, partial [Puia sp.]
MQNAKPFLYTSMSPALLNLYNASQATVVIIDVLRATSTIATALFNGARYIVPVDSVAKCIELGRQINCITAGERDGKIAEGLSYGNSPFEYSRPFINGKILVLTTTNGTRLLQMALDKGAREIVTGSFANLDTLTEYLIRQKNNVILACAAWKDRINIEDTLFAGAVIEKIRAYFTIECDASHIAANLYIKAA